MDILNFGASKVHQMVCSVQVRRRDLPDTNVLRVRDSKAFLFNLATAGVVSSVFFAVIGCSLTGCALLGAVSLFGRCVVQKSFTKPLSLPGFAQRLATSFLNPMPKLTCGNIVIFYKVDLEKVFG